MPTPIRAISFFAIVLTVFAGCSVPALPKVPTGSTVDTHTTGYTTSSGDGKPGYDIASAGVATFKWGASEPRKLGFFTDVQHMQLGSVIDSQRLRAEGACTKGSGGTPTQWSAETSDGKTYQVKIADQVFDLNNGNFFVLSTIPGPVVVKQIHCNLDDFPTDTDPVTLGAWMSKYPDIEKFYKERNP